MGKIEIHGIIASPPTRAALLVAKAVGVPHELIVLDPINKTPEFKKLNPQQQIPVLVDDGLVLPESRAIMKYLVDKYAKDDSLYPKDVKTRALVNARLDFDCGTLWPRALAAIRPKFFGGEVPEEATQALRDAIGVVEEFLTREKWVAGPKMTIADISYSAFFSGVSALNLDLTPHPKILKWLEECRKTIPNYSLNDEGLASLKERIAQLRQAANKA